MQNIISLRINFSYYKQLNINYFNYKSTSIVSFIHVLILHYTIIGQKKLDGYCACSGCDKIEGERGKTRRFHLVRSINSRRLATRRPA